MDPINANTSNINSEVELYALKKAIDVQEVGMLKVLESVAPMQPEAKTSSSSFSGLGQSLDIRA